MCPSLVHRFPDQRNPLPERKNSKWEWFFTCPNNIAFKSDWLYPAYQSQEIVRACKVSGVDATYCEIYSTYGHDAFLLEFQQETHLIKHFLKRIFDGETAPDHD